MDGWILVWRGGMRPREREREKEKERKWHCKFDEKSGLLTYSKLPGFLKVTSLIHLE
jgi:hypothetical protein